MISDVVLIYSGEGESLRDSVYNSLKKAIMTGVLLPDERLMEIPIANQLGVSRTPVREAIQRLEKELLVISSPRCGAKVAGITYKAVKDALDVRIGVETMVVRFAADNITVDQLEELKSINNEIRQTLDEGNVVKISDLDNLLHRKIVEATGNNVLKDIMRMLEEHVLRYRYEYIKSIKGSSRIVEEHDLIIEALENKDVEAASKYMMEHISRQQEEICKIIYDKLNN